MVRNIFQNDKVSWFILAAMIIISESVHAHNGIEKIIFVPTYAEVDCEWLLNSGFSRVDVNDSIPAVYRKGNDIIAITGVGLEKTHQSLQKIWKMPFCYADRVDLILTGTAGSYTIPVYSIVNCNTDFESIGMEYKEAKLTCVHEFVSTETPHPELQLPGVCFDMESEAFVQELNRHSPFQINTFSILKVISDGGDGTEDDWETATIKYCRPKIQTIIKDFLKYEAYRIG